MKRLLLAIVHGAAEAKSHEMRRKGKEAVGHGITSILSLVSTLLITSKSQVLPMLKERASHKGMNARMQGLWESP